MPGARPDDLIAALGLEPHPEGGWFRETWRHEPDAADRGAGTAIYYLLAEGERSHWHRIDATEIWHYYAGNPLALSLSPGGEITVGRDVLAGHQPQVVVPPGAWQSAASTGRWSLVGCTVSPAFSFDGFELAPPGWRPH